MDPEADPYRVLGVPRDATHEEIGKAHRRLAMEAHPDRAGGSAAAARMRAINAAWAVLGDPRARARWDAAHLPPSGVARVGGTTWQRGTAWAPRASTLPPVSHSGRGAWLALALVLVLMAVMLVGGVIAAASRPTIPGSTSPGYHGNLP